MSQLTQKATNATFWEVPEEAVTGAWAEKRRLAGALRELVSLCVRTDAPEDVLREAADMARRLADSLHGYPERDFQTAHKHARDAADVHMFADRSPLVGDCNPLAPPIRFAFADGVTTGHVTFPAAYEGAPGWVHGGLVAAAFDQLFGHLQVCLGVPSLTGSLTIHYRQGTPLLTPLRFEGRVVRRDGRKNYVVGQCFADGQLTAEADSVFVEVDPARLRQMFQETADRRSAAK